MLHLFRGGIVADHNLFTSAPNFKGILPARESVRLHSTSFIAFHKQLENSASEKEGGMGYGNPERHPTPGFSPCPAQVIAPARRGL